MQYVKTAFKRKKFILTKNSLVIQEYVSPSSSPAFRMGYLERKEQLLCDLEEAEIENNSGKISRIHIQLQNLDLEREEYKEWYSGQRVGRIRKIAECNYFSKFLHLTFANRDITIDECYEEFEKFIKRLKTYIKKISKKGLEDFRYIAKFELNNKKGEYNPHFHVIINCPFLSNYSNKGKDGVVKLNAMSQKYLDSLKRTRHKEFKTKVEQILGSGGSLLAALWSNGFVKMENISNLRGSIIYATKYCTKGATGVYREKIEMLYKSFEKELEGKKIIWTSRTNIKKPVKLSEEE